MVEDIYISLMIIMGALDMATRRGYSLTDRHEVSGPQREERKSVRCSVFGGPVIHIFLVRGLQYLTDLYMFQSTIGKAICNFTS